MMSRAAQTYLAGHMRSAGRVFETPDLQTGARYESNKLIYLFVRYG
jgi:hypothetical protein